MSDTVKEMMQNAVAGRSPSLFYIEYHEVDEGAPTIHLRRVSQPENMIFNLGKHLRLTFMSATLVERISMMIQKAEQLLLPEGIMRPSGQVVRLCVQQLLDEDGKQFYVHDPDAILPWVMREDLDLWSRYENKCVMISPKEIKRVREDIELSKPLRYIVLALMEEHSVTTVSKPKAAFPV
ncbi:MAG: hypothetical protein ABH846_02005 [Patescibacteria group bacterium]